jgi:glycosyltransferase involved in cell wall biosynthesis
MISVIIPMYNSASTIERALQSVVKQDYSGPVEIIVVNDGSSDNCIEIVENFITVNQNTKIVLISQDNGGVSKARNTGLKNARGNFVAFLDSDDAWFTNKLSNQMKILEDNIEVDLLGTAFDGFYFTKKIEGELFNVEFKDLIFKNYFQPSTVILRKNVIDKIGLFDESQKYAEEGNFFFRVSQEFSCFFYNKKLIIYGDGKQGFGVSGLSANLKEMEKGELKNLKFAYKNNWINLFTYGYAVSFSILKYVRRIIIVSLKKYETV